MIFFFHLKVPFSIDKNINSKYFFMALFIDFHVRKNLYKIFMVNHWQKSENATLTVQLC